MNTLIITIFYRNIFVLYVLYEFYFQNELTSLTKVTTVPYVFIHKKYIGGGTTIENLYKNGQLKKILNNID